MRDSFVYYIRCRYRHPKKEVFERYGALRIRRLRTDDAGAISFDVGPDLVTNEYRRAHARYWFEP